MPEGDHRFQGKKEELAADATDLLADSDGGMTTPEIHDELWPEYQDYYNNEDVFRRILIYVRQQLEDRGEIVTEPADGDGSIQTHRWKLVGEG